MNPISNNTIGGIQGLPGFSPVGGAKVEGSSFGETLSNSLREVNSLQQDADKAVESLFTGGDANPAEVLTAVQKADLAFRTMMQIRNKLVQAYDELKNIRV